MQKQSVQKYLQNEIQKKKMTIYEEIASSDRQIERLLSKKWKNPYEVLLLSMNVPVEKISKHYKRFVLSLHPDKCSNEKSKDALSVIQKAYKILQDPNSQKIYKRILKEAYDKTIYEREQSNKKKRSKNLPCLPEDTFDFDLKINCRRLFNEIEEKKNQLLKMDEDLRKSRNQKLEILALKEHYKLLTEEEWDKNRVKRIKKWKNFKSRNNKIGSRNSDHSIRSFKKKFDSYKRF